MKDSGRTLTAVTTENEQEVEELILPQNEQGNQLSIWQIAPQLDISKCSVYTIKKENQST